MIGDLELRCTIIQDKAIEYDVIGLDVNYLILLKTLCAFVYTSTRQLLNVSSWRPVLYGVACPCRPAVRGAMCRYPPAALTPKWIKILVGVTALNAQVEIASLHHNTNDN